MAAAAAAAVPEAKEKKTAKGLWTGTLKKAMEYDTWGQSLEAIEEYEKLIKLMEAHQKELQTLSVDEKTVLQLTIACAKLRCVNLHDVHGKAGLKAADLKPIPDVLELMFTGKPLPPFPVQIADMPQLHAQPADDDGKHRAAAGACAGAAAVGKPSAANAAAAAAGDPDLDASVAAAGDDTKEVGGTLLPKKAYRPGTTSMSVYLDRVGLKDAETYFEPRVTVTVVNELGQVVGDPQDTPNSKRKKPQAVLFGHTIHIQPSWEDMVAGKLTVFFEFKHFKFQKKMVSTRCFAILETREIKSPEQTLNLELYKKPTDWAKKKLSLFTIKPLYCTVTVHLQKH